MYKTTSTKVFNGTENISLYDRAVEGYITFYFGISDMATGTGNWATFGNKCSHLTEDQWFYIYQNTTEGAKKEMFATRDSAREMYFRISNTHATTLAEIKSYLTAQYNNGTPLTLLYQLKEPTTTEITDTTLIEQLENVLKMSTYKNTTNIFSIVASGNAQGELKVEYRADLQTKLDNLDSRLALVE